MASGSTTLPLRSCILQAVAAVLAFVATPEASASELIGRDATDVRVQADAQGRALISFRSGGQPGSSCWRGAPSMPGPRAGL